MQLVTLDVQFDAETGAKLARVQVMLCPRRPGDALKNDLPAINGGTSWTLPMPARYVIGEDGTILYAEVNPD